MLEGLGRFARRVAEGLRRAASPGPDTGVVLGLLADLLRSRSALVAENAMLRHQLQVAARRVKRPVLRSLDRVLFVLLAAVLSTWREALVIIKPETVLRWHREGFRLLWRWRSQRRSPPKPLLDVSVIDLIKQMATDNRLWGAERIRGEMLKLGITAAKSTIQRYIAQIRCKPPPGQRWSTFLRNQAHGIWACDLFEVRDLWFRSHHVFVVMHLETRRLLLAATTRAPNAAWLAQQLRNLTPFGEGPKFLLRDHDAKFGIVFDAVARGTGTRVVCTPIRAPKANSYVERLIGTLRRECTDHIIVLGEGHLQRVLDEYRDFYNDARPHQGIGQRRPSRLTEPARRNRTTPRAISARPVLGELHHDYRVTA